MSVEFARRSALGAVAGVSLTFGAFLSTVIIARALGPSATGAVAYLVWLVLIITPILDLGTSTAVARFVPDLNGQGRPAEAGRLASYLARIVVTAALAGCLGLFAYAWLAGPGGAPSVFRGLADAQERHALWIVTGLFILVQTVTTYSYAYLRGIQDFETYARLTVTCLVVQTIGIAAGSLLFGVTGAVAGYLAGNIIPALYSIRLLGGPAGVEPGLLVRVRRYAGYAWPANLASAFVWSRVEVFFLERYWGTYEVAMFTVALALTSLATQGPVLLTSGVLPMLSESKGRDDIDGMKRAFATGTRLLAAIGFPACLGLAVILPALVPLIYGADFAAAAMPASVVLCVAAFSVAATMSHHVLQAAERSDVIFAFSLVGAAFSVAAGFALVPEFGLMGAVVARAAIQLLMVAMGTWFVVVRLGFPLPVAALGRLLVAAIACAVVAAACLWAIPGPAALLLAIPTAMLAYLVCLRAIKALPESDIALLTGIAAALPRPLAGTAGGLIRFLGGYAKAAGRSMS